MKPIVLATVATLGFVVGGAAIIEGAFVTSWQSCADDQP